MTRRSMKLRWLRTSVSHMRRWQPMRRRKLQPRRLLMCSLRHSSCARLRHMRRLSPVARATRAPLLRGQTLLPLLRCAPLLRGQTMQPPLLCVRALRRRRLRLLWLLRRRPWRGAWATLLAWLLWLRTLLRRGLCG
jgi:hypothetical protein